MTDLPAGWHTESVNDLARGGLFIDGDWVESKDQDPNGTVRLTQLADVGVGEFRDRSNRWMREDQAKRLGCTFLQPGDVLIARMPDPIGRACLVPENIGRAVTAVDVAILRPARDDLDPRYLMWAINSPHVHECIASLQSGTTRKRVSRKNLATVGIPVPSLTEQKRIVEVLEEHLSRLDAGVDYLDAARRRCARYEDATIMRALGSTESRLDGVEQIINGHLPALAEGWYWQPLGEVADVVGGVTKDAKKQSNLSYIEVPYLRVANVQRARLDLENVTTLRVPPAKAEALRLLKGDVLMNEGGDRDKLARGWVWDGQIEECIHQNHVFRARPRDTMRSEWLAWCANTYGARWAQRHGKQSVNLASISLKVIKTMPIPVPPLPEQDERLALIHEAVSRSRRLIGEVEIGLARADRLRRSLLTAAFSGRLTGVASDIERSEEIATEAIKAEVPEGVLF
ncbi:restriction endonuclease subunit S [[Kitasatospora] papulosa]|uniref:restriction endonuclease subunit S n=1 Tax=[Kitasatospora] papulosa TaxID=1464011 RepID=UPI0036D1BC0C